MCDNCECCHVPDHGACSDFEQGMNGRCVYCDHAKGCHPGAGKTFNLPLGTGHREESWPDRVEQWAIKAVQKLTVFIDELNTALSIFNKTGGMMDNRIVYLEINSYIGVSPGASHFYGHLTRGGRDDHIDLVYSLSEKQATEINKIYRRLYPGDDFFLVRPGQKYSGYFTKEDIIKQAKKEWKTHYPEGELLILGRSSVADPQPVLEGPAEIKDKINAWHNRCEELEWDYNNPEVSKITDDFWEFFISFCNSPRDMIN